jgi:hypothetical protein
VASTTRASGTRRASHPSYAISANGCVVFHVNDNVNSKHGRRLFCVLVYLQLHPLYFICSFVVSTTPFSSSKLFVCIVDRHPTSLNSKNGFTEGSEGMSNLDVGLNLVRILDASLILRIKNQSILTAHNYTRTQPPNQSSGK